MTDSLSMSDTLTVGLTEEERSLLLRGLRFVRSSVMLEVADPEPEADGQRREQLREINELTERLNRPQGARPKG